MTQFQKISIVIPCRNEKKFIGNCLDSVIQNGYPLDHLEVLVVDGMSDDGCRDIINDYCKKYNFIRLVDNIQKITPVAFNLGIKNSIGEIIVIMSSHATFENGYLNICSQYLLENDVECVGGVWKIVPTNESIIAKSITRSLSSFFGVGNSYYRLSGLTKPREVDAVAYGCYKSQTFRKYGLFNEKLKRGQDLELNRRITRTGGKIILLPNASINYFARSEYNIFLKHNYMNGLWAIIPIKYSEQMPVSLRHLVPCAFTLSLFSTGALSIISNVSLIIFLIITCVYMFFNLIFSIKIAFSERNAIFIITMPLVFLTLHMAYGFGSLIGLFSLLTTKRKDISN